MLVTEYKKSYSCRGEGHCKPKFWFLPASVAVSGVVWQSSTKTDQETEARANSSLPSSPT